MTTEPIAEHPYAERLTALRTALDASPAPTRPEDRDPIDAPGPQPPPERPEQLQ